MATVITRWRDSMADQTIRIELARLGLEVRATLFARGYTIASFAHRCSYDEKTVRNAFVGRCRVGTMKNMCEELGVPFLAARPETITSPPSGSAAPHLGSYSRHFYENYAGHYRFMIGEATHPQEASFGICELQWCMQTPGLRFCETFYAQAAGSKPAAARTRQGFVHVNSGVNLLHLISHENGNTSLVTLTHLSPETGTMGGIVLGVQWRRTHYMPSSAPIIYRKTETLACLAAEGGSATWPRNEEEEAILHAEIHELKSELARCNGFSGFSH
jgi:hypothetical protein